MLLAAIVLVLISAVDAKRRVPWHAASLLVILYVFASLATLQLAIWTNLTDSPLLDVTLQSVRAGEGPAIFVFLLQNFAAWAATFARPTHVLEFRINENWVYSSIEKFVPWVLGILTAGLIIHASSLDWDKYWRAYGYLELNSAQYMGIRFFPAVIFHDSMPIVLVLTGALSLLLMSEGRRAAGVWAGGIFAYCWIYELAAHSRWAGASIALAAGAYFLFGRRRRIAVLACAIPAFLIFYLHALIGRNSGEYGLSSLFSVLAFYQSSLLPQYAYITVYTWVQGIFTTALSFRVPSGDYASLYKILSFSPLPSVLDGFNKILPANEVRINANMPLSGFVEAQRFGLLYESLLFGTLFVSLYLNTKLAKSSRNPIIVILSVMSVVFFMFLGCYEIRNVYRFVLLLILAEGALLYFAHERSHRLGRTAPVAFRDNVWRRSQDT